MLHITNTILILFLITEPENGEAFSREGTFSMGGCAIEDKHFIEDIQYATLTNSMQKLTKIDQDLLVGFEDDGI